MDGGSASDRFVFAAISDSGPDGAQRDVIDNFESGDLIDLAAIDANASVSGDQAFNFVAVFTGTAGQLQWEQIGAGSFVVSADVDGDATADFSLQIYGVPGVTQVQASDFSL
jgi:hypothetical protein